MVLYWLAIVMPAPLLMSFHGLSPVRAVYVAWRGGKHTRWQQFFLLVICVFWNAVAAIPLGLGLLISIPFTIYVLSDYVRAQNEQHVFNDWLPSAAD